ncbi:hypothetical protein [Nostoc sp.]|uniref:hypothetical protein n=1 Tax=Nostoc sp. TaxID=1180 RepID=UPI002FF6EA49
MNFFPSSLGALLYERLRVYLVSRREGGFFTRREARSRFDNFYNSNRIAIENFRTGETTWMEQP